MPPHDPSEVLEREMGAVEDEHEVSTDAAGTRGSRETSRDLLALAPIVCLLSASTHGGKDTYGTGEGDEQKDTRWSGLLCYALL